MDCDTGAVAVCACVGAGDATLVGWADAGAAGACFACAMKLVSASAAIAAKGNDARVTKCRDAKVRVVWTRMFSLIEIAFGDFGDTSNRVTNRVVNLRRANRSSMRKRDGPRCAPTTQSRRVLRLRSFASLRKTASKEVGQLLQTGWKRLKTRRARRCRALASLISRCSHSVCWEVGLMI